MPNGLPWNWRPEESQLSSSPTTSPRFMLSAAKSFLTMKRPRPSAQPPSTPPTPQTLRRSKLRKISTRKPFLYAAAPTPNPQPDPNNWAPLNLTKSDLSLPLTFPTGQTFRWKQTGNLQYTGPVGPHLISLKHDPENGDVYYLVHRTPCEAKARLALLDFLNAGVCLSNVWEVFKGVDQRFAELAGLLGGVRVLRQDPVECLFQFLCSSNNNIGRITKMVGYVESLGQYLGSVGGFEFYEFPRLTRLSEVSEDDLRKAGFGYRAKYIVGTMDTLMLKPGGGAEWLISLRKLDLPDVLDALCSLPGVGPKVAACIALFSLDQHHAIPVDTHVWQIATRHLLPELAGARLTPKLCSRVAEAFVSKYGKYAGWAQTLLFVAELPAQRALLPSHMLAKEEIELTEEKDA